jgi:hypothetical protein
VIDEGMTDEELMEYARETMMEDLEGSNTAGKPK